MKITSVDVMKIPSEDPSFSGNGQGSKEDWCPLVIRINTGKKISGFGEAGLAYGKGWRGGFGMLQDFSEVIIGEDPLNNEKIWNKLLTSTYWGIAGGVVVNAAISAIDIALWDIKGKYYNTPVYELLGGKTNDHLRAYASQLQYNWGEHIDKLKLITPEEYAEVTRKIMAEGYDALKFDPIMLSDQPDGGGAWQTKGVVTKHIVDVAYNRVKAMREAGGDNLGLIIDMHANSDTTSAIKIGQALEDLDIMYYEEPVSTLNPDNTLEVANKVNIPIAAGERVFTRFGFRKFFEDRSIKVAQPDLCLAGGITEAKKICDMAYTYDINAQVHVCGGPIAVAAALQVEAVIPNFLIHEVYQRARNAKDRATCKFDDFQPVNGHIDIPDRPGIGQELTPETIDKSQRVTIQ
ncbi:MAG: mandelate racemase/muconate lactonizing enzyme family protein [Furfurilactobacillus sp.]|jgi:L-alanine-DL-glutamate epimerase-like enolase superfamily enzyme|nr:mandelate racemase/muconate lactonizing enzyme family protein [Furfurilactobacillus sp.]MCH4010960.1 mandelate racemase/muconate lactonizing enzyme family protein [Furfurilactobacillus sp.]MCH4036852.1 mandelate racemase/muconate lactonizing enzyme family protein [Furfurilactobacillus sp.]MCH4114202.1 mandelate racemase/muconate lactonizing enzyme family protein [Furfurilactobacillus sp.]MCH4132975.1 mandelate racemase/muconate lactonizing enzyme family protein [Furfurilactobacillus sp.]MCI